MAATEKTISSLIKTQLPDFVKADHPKFKRFLELYYQWLETNEPEGISNTAGNTIYHAMNIGDYRDIDQTPDDFLTFFKRELLPHFPENTALDIRKILKSAREFYSKKGSVESVKWLFKVLFDEDIEITYPKEQILKTSDGKWKQPKAFRITVGETNKNIDVNLLEKKLVVGVDSGATCVVESANRTVDSNNGKEIIEIYISNIKRYFNNGEYIKINYTDTNGIDKVFSEKIVGTISNIYLDSNIKTDPQQKKRGLLYNIGDPAVITGGLALTAEAEPGIAIVGNVSTGSIEAVTTVFPGYGYRKYSDLGLALEPHPNTEVLVLRSIGDDPNANLSTDLRVFALNLTSNTANSQRNFIEPITYDKTVIDYLGSTVIGDADFAEFTSNNFNALINVTEDDQTDDFNNFEQVWANGNNYFDALFTAKIATPNGNTKIFGTVNVSSTSNVVTGVGTAFDVELKVGQKLEVAGNRRTIDAITNNYHLTTTTAYPSTLTAQTAYRIGTFAAHGGVGTQYTGGLLLYDIANTGALPTILAGQSIYTKNTAKQFVYNTVTTSPVSANANSQLVQCFKFVTVNTGGIALVSVINGGAGFKSAPTLRVTSEYDTILSENYSILNAAPSRANTIQTFKDLGLIAHVYINNGGSGYANGDTITFSGRGYSGNANVVVGANGTIKSINLIDRGEGHLVRPTCIINTSGGTGAVLTAYLFGDGFENQVSTSAIGRIKDIKLIYRGYDYVSRPNVSLKVLDTVIDAIPEYQNFTEEEYIFQGTSLSTSSFRANVKSYNRTTNVLRLYDFSGSLDTTINLTSANGVVCSVNTSANVPAPSQYPSATIATGLPNPMKYGDGAAKALASFANGLIEFNGFYINTDGFVSADKVLQDGHIYHNFSYMIQSGKDLAEYQTSLKNIAHPSGLIAISKRTIDTEENSWVVDYPTVDYIKPTNTSSNVQISNSYSNVVTGNNTGFVVFNNATGTVNVSGTAVVGNTTNANTTYFVGNVAVGNIIKVNNEIRIVTDVTDNNHLVVNSAFTNAATNKTLGIRQNKVNVGDLFMIVDSGNPLRSLSKVVSQVDSDTQLKVDGDFIYAGQGKGSTNSGNNWLSISGLTNTISDFVQNGDKVRINLTSVIVDGKVDTISVPIAGTVNVSGNIVIGNTTGSNTTYFVGNVIVGDYITINNETRIVTSVTNNSNLIVNSAFTNSATDKYLLLEAGVISHNTHFVGNVVVGTEISVNNQIYRVTAVTDDLNLVVNSAATYAATSKPISVVGDRTLNGTVSVTAACTSITGLSTNFVGNITAGIAVSVNNQVRNVTTVTSDTQLVVDSPFTYSGSGNTIIRKETAKTLDGVVDISGTAIVSRPTHFVGNVVVGSEITINNETRLVKTVTDNYNLVVNNAFTHAATDKYLVANSVIIKTVSSVSGNNMIMNSAYFATKTNLVYQVVPDYSQDYSYKILTLTAN